MPLQIERYSESPSKKDFIAKFLQFPSELFKGDLSVKLIPQEIEAMYFKMHPLAHEFFLITEDGKTVLRSMVCLTPSSEIAYFGLFDFDYKSLRAESYLGEFKKVLGQWARSFDVQKILGPINFSTWLPYRLTSFIDGGESFSFEPDKPLMYCDLLKRSGFTTNQVFSSKGYDELSNIINLSKSEYDKALSLGYRFEFLSKELTIDDLRDLHRLSISIFEGNYLATPIDFETFRALYVAQSKKEDYSLSFFIISPSGERVGFFVNFIENNYCVIKTIGIDKAHRGTGISNGSIYLTLTRARDLGFNRMVAAMVKEGAQSESYGKKMNLMWTHLYEILELKL